MENGTETGQVERFERVRKKRGPKPRLGATVQTTLMIDPDLVEWGKDQPGGLSETVRQLLAQARAQQQKQQQKQQVGA